MRHSEVPPAQRVVTARWEFTETDHRRAGHFNPGNFHPGVCEGCAREAAHVNHPSVRGRTPANLAYWDQVAAREREESAAGGRALAFVVVTLARVLFLSLAVVGIAADVPVLITVLCGALMLALLPVVLPRRKP